MQKIIYIQSYQGKKAGETDNVPNNVAHGLIEKGIARIFGIYGEYQRQSIDQPPVDKMMKTRGRKKYNTK